jgi:site-specific DNA-methyltransferase (adenine-specific)
MIQGETYTVHIGNNLDILPTLPDNSVDSIVTDPPYELGFMGKKWDSSGIAYSVELWRECLRVLKPGGHLLSFGGTRTWHRVAVGIEDAGFEVRDSIAWMYGSGFPKSLDVSKAIDKAAGAKREVLTKTVSDLFGEREEEKSQRRMSEAHGGIVGNHASERIEIVRKETAPATQEAQQWEGWGTALKPAFEPIVVARKPLIGTVAENVLEHGTAALNIDGSRIETIDNLNGGRYSDDKDETDSVAFGKGVNIRSKNDFKQPSGRWPANVILDEYSAEVLDEQTVNLKAATSRTARNKHVPMPNHPQLGDLVTHPVYTDTGGASRFYYVAKASKRDRNEGLDELEDGDIPYRSHRANFENTKGIETPFAGAGRSGNDLKNFHPTVKPTQLMRYLVKLVTPPGGTVLDPFTGSGSTGKAAILEGFRFIGCELTEDYIPIIEGRLKHAELIKAELEAKEDEALF